MTKDSGASAAARVRELAGLSRDFGKPARVRKLEILRGLAGADRLSASALRRLHDTLIFMRAYPDSADVREAVGEVVGCLRRWAGELAADELGDSGIAGTWNWHPYSYEVLRRLVQTFPGMLEVAWEDLEGEERLLGALAQVLPAGEVQAIEDILIDLREWIDRARTDAGETDLEVLLRAFSTSGLPLGLAAHLYEECDLPVRFRLEQAGAARAEIELPCAGITYQEHAIERERFELEPWVRRRLQVPRALPAARGREMLDRANAALCSRNLEIYPLIYAAADDVTVLRCERGIDILFAGMEVEMRNPLESVFFFLVCKNGVPIAYGPAAPFAGCCELGINLFPEFRGSEVRRVYAEVLRALHHLHGVEHFCLTVYAMGEGNEEAIRSGAFWFYRKLGFVPTNPAVEELAREEEARMRKDPAHRSSRAMLRQLSHTGASLDLSGGRREPIQVGLIGMALSERIAKTHGGDRGRALATARRRLERVLGLRSRDLDPGERWALEAMSPILDLIDDLETWSDRERAALARIVRGKGGRSERRAALAICGHERLIQALAGIAC